MNSYPAAGMPNGEKKTRKGSGIIVLNMIAAAIIAAAYAFYSNAVIGWQTTDIAVDAVSVSDNSIQLTGELNGFAGLRGYSYVIEEDTVVVTLDCTWPVFGRDGDVDILLEDDFSRVLEVNISDGRNRLVVWTED